MYVVLKDPQVASMVPEETKSTLIEGETADKPDLETVNFYMEKIRGEAFGDSIYKMARNNLYARCMEVSALMKKEEMTADMRITNDHIIGMCNGYALESYVTRGAALYIVGITQMGKNDVTAGGWSLEYPDMAQALFEQVSQASFT